MYFSIIIPTHNRADSLMKVLDSVLAQEFKDYEVLIVDDGSTDQTEDRVKERFGHIENIKYIRQENKERAAARNTGARLAKGKYVNFFDSDDLMYPNHLSEAYSLIQKLTNPEMFALSFDSITSEGELIFRRIYPANINKTLIEGNHLSCNSVFLRKDIALENPFNEDRNLSVFEDWELWLRLASRYKIHTSPEITSAINNHTGRSVYAVNKDRLIKRGTLLVSYLTSDDSFVNRYKDDLSKLKSSVYSYVSLHLALSKEYRFNSIQFCLKALMSNPRFIYKRRFLAIIKHWP